MEYSEHIEYYRDKLLRVRLARKVIKSGYFSNNQINDICKWLGFDDTAFKDKSSAGKLKDYLLSEKYWMERLNKFVFCGDSSIIRSLN